MPVIDYGIHVTTPKGSSNEQKQVKYWITVDDDTDESDVIAWAGNASNLPLTHHGFVLDYYEYEPTGQFSWELTAHYKIPGSDNNPSPPPVGTAKFRWRVSGESANIKYPVAPQAVGGADSYVPSGDTKTVYEGIGDTGKELKGVDIIVPKIGFAYDFTVPALTVDAAYINAIEGLVGKVNNAVFDGRAAGTVLLENLSGDYTLGEDSTITFEFARSDNETGLSIGNITGISKGGWQYLDAHTTKTTDNNRVKNRVTQVDIWTVYLPGDFSLLQIPGT